MTLDELKAEALKLPVEERCALSDFLSRSDEVRAQRHLELKAAIQVGLDDLEHGRFTTIQSEEDQQALIDGVRRRGAALLRARQGQGS